ncbi:hypothetical protein O6R05_02725 [Peptoniphilus equinus]|uniref:Uncharacterized protein n=1 Tax=Peptoniphilus equinus TaxID=3016343 RepID=A0ABY7QVU3_9FIRM|nr:hypothetical protein [Peptoniphilus equinus]WBW50476.1 hypothetical protein O6R05_02725 [Peptoniphilus equinus]
MRGKPIATLDIAIDYRMVNHDRDYVLIYKSDLSKIEVVECKSSYLVIFQDLGLVMSYG